MSKNKYLTFVKIIFFPDYFEIKKQRIADFYKNITLGSINLS